MKLKNLDLIKISCLTAASLVGMACTQPKVENPKSSQIESESTKSNMTSDKESRVSYEKNDADYCPACGLG